MRWIWDPNKDAVNRAKHRLSLAAAVRVFDDPLALRIIRPEVAQELRNHPPARESSRLAPYLRAFFAARSRLAEDALRESVGNGYACCRERAVADGHAGRLLLCVAGDPPCRDVDDLDLNGALRPGVHAGRLLLVPVQD